MSYVHKHCIYVFMYMGGRVRTFVLISQMGSDHSTLAGSPHEIKHNNNNNLYNTLLLLIQNISQ